MNREPELIDLTMRLAADTPVYPGDPVVGIEVTDTFADAGYFNTRLTLGSHNGTHIDAEGHMIPGGRMLDAYPLRQFRGRGVLLDVRDERDEVSAVGELDGDCIALLWTGRGDAQPGPDYYTRPVSLPDGLVEVLTERGVKMVGIDAGSIDVEPYPVHRALLGQGILIAENLVGLGAVAARLGAGDARDGGAAAEFSVWALPLNLAVEASPARVVAVLVPVQEIPTDRSALNSEDGACVT